MSTVEFRDGGEEREETRLGCLSESRKQSTLGWHVQSGKKSNANTTFVPMENIGLWVTLIPTMANSGCVCDVLSLPRFFCLFLLCSR